MSKTLRVLLLLTAGVNVVGGLVAALFPGFVLDRLFASGAPVDAAASSSHTILWLWVALFGVCYYFAATDARYLRPMLFLGGFGKLIAVLVWAFVMLGGNRSWFLAEAILVDGVLGVYFLLSLRRLNASISTANPGT